MRKTNKQVSARSIPAPRVRKTAKRVDPRGVVKAARAAKIAELTRDLSAKEKRAVAVANENFIVKVSEETGERIYGARCWGRPAKSARNQNWFEQYIWENHECDFIYIEIDRPEGVTFIDVSDVPASWVAQVYRLHGIGEFGVHDDFESDVA